MLRVSLLGSFRLAEDERTLRLTVPRRGIALLAYILLHRPGRVYRDALAATFWPDVTDNEARGKLRRLLYVVASALGEQRATRWLAIEASTIGWNPDAPVEIDVDAMRAAAGDGRWGDAVAAYGGDLLAGFEDEWIVEERDRLRQQHLIDLERHARTLRTQRHFADASGVLGELLRLEPWREDALRALMDVRAAMGDRAGALAEYDRFSQRLRADLDVEPMTETRALYEDVRAGRVAAVAHEPETLATRRPFVGRDVQLVTLRECSSRAERGRGGLVFLGGESGVGKSRLLEEFGAESAQRGALVLRGSTSFIETLPYQAVIAALGSVASRLAQAGVEATWLGALENVMPGATGFIGNAASNGDAEAERRRLFEAVAVTLETLARTQPVVLLLDDLHAAGSATIALLEYVARRIAAARVTIVATYRDGDVPLAHPLRELRRRLQRAGGATSLALAPLETGDVEALLAASFPDVTPAVARRYYDLTEGSPLYLSELIADAVKAGTRLPKRPARDMPAGLAATLEHRLRSVSAPAREALEFAAVIGTGFDVELLAAVSGWSEASAADRIGELLEKHIVRESGDAYDFAHTYYAEFAYVRIDEPARRRRHQRIGRALEALYPARRGELAAELARHFAIGGDDTRASDYYLAGARAALDVYAHEDAFAYAGLALEHARDGARELAILLVREDASRLMGKRDVQRSDLDRAYEIARKGTDPDAVRAVMVRRIELAHALADRDEEQRAIEYLESIAAGKEANWRAAASLARGKFALAVSRYREAGPALDAAIEAFTACDDQRGLFQTYMLRATLARVGGSPGEVLRSFASAQSVVDRVPQPLPLVAALHEARANYALAEKKLEAQTWAALLLETAEELGDVQRRARGHYLAANAAAQRFDVDVAREHTKRALAVFESIGDRYNAFPVLASSGVLLTKLGHLEEATATMLRAKALAEEVNFPLGVASSAVNLSITSLWQRRFVESAGYAREAVERATEIEAPFLLAPALVNLGAAQRELLHLRASIETIERACEIADESAPSQSLDAYAELALSCARAGDVRRARRAIDISTAAASEMLESSTYWHWCVAEALRLCGASKEAARLEATGAELVRKFASSLPEDASRRAYLALAHNESLIRSTSANRLRPHALLAKT